MDYFRQFEYHTRLERYSDSHSTVGIWNTTIQNPNFLKVIFQLCKFSNGRALAMVIAFAPAIQKLDHLKSGCFCLDFKWFLTFAQIFSTIWFPTSPYFRSRLYVSENIKAVLPVKGESHEDESVSQALHTDADGPVTQVRVLRLLNRVEVHVDDLDKIKKYLRPVSSWRL